MTQPSNLSLPPLPHVGLANLSGLQVNFENRELYHRWLAGHGDHWAYSGRD
jgi:hypothetical protein